MAPKFFRAAAFAANVLVTWAPVKLIGSALNAKICSKLRTPNHFSQGFYIVVFIGFLH